MKIFYLALALFVLPSQAKEPETITYKALCDDTNKLVNKIREHKETPIIIGKAFDQANSTMTLWINNKTKSWTLLATKNNMSCILGVGDNINVLPYKEVLQIKSSKMQ